MTIYKYIHTLALIYLNITKEKMAENILLLAEEMVKVDPKVVGSWVIKYDGFENIIENRQDLKTIYSLFEEKGLRIWRIDPIGKENNIWFEKTRSV